MRTAIRKCVLLLAANVLGSTACGSGTHSETQPTLLRSVPLTTTVVVPVPSLPTTALATWPPLTDVMATSAPSVASSLIEIETGCEAMPKVENPLTESSGFQGAVQEIQRRVDSLGAMVEGSTLDFERVQVVVVVAADASETQLSAVAKAFNDPELQSFVRLRHSCIDAKEFDRLRAIARMSWMSKLPRSGCVVANLDIAAAMVEITAKTTDDQWVTEARATLPSRAQLTVVHGDDC